MARCWTCGTHTADPRYSCATCLQLIALREVRDAAHAASVDAAGRLDLIAALHRQTHESLLAGFDRLNQSLEWGFSSLLWSIDQQTDVLKSIDATLKTPGQTQADEWRKIGEGLRQRGDAGSAVKFFIDALALNPLDYRIYLGLAHTYFELARFEDADRVLTASLPHAPRKGFDYRSVTHRLMGRVRFCNEQFDGAVEQLRRAVSIEPRYAKAFYDLAQYSSCIPNEHDCVASLTDAIALEPSYWYAARAEPLFDRFRPQVDAVLQSMLADSLARADKDLQRAIGTMTELRRKLEDCKSLGGPLKRRVFSAEARVNEVDCALQAARTPFNSSDYKTALGAADRVARVCKLADDALKHLEKELEDLRIADTARRAAAKAAEEARRAADEARRRKRNRILSAIGSYFLIAGTVGLIATRTFDGFLSGLLVAVLIPIGIAIVVGLIDG